MGTRRFVLRAAPSFPGARALSLASAWAFTACGSPFAASHEIDRPGDAARASAVAIPTSRPAAGPERPLIAKLQFRDVELAILSSAGGPRFSVATTDGTVLAADLGDAELRALYPAVYQVYRSALARSGGPYLDARLDARHADEMAPR